MVSSGSADELAKTSEEVMRCVRLYFRPKTPTQYYAEGIKSSVTLIASRHPSAHCPVPVFFLFDSCDVLTRRDTRFSSGGLNTPTPILLSTATELAGMPWQTIYHSRPYNKDLDPTISHFRNAEVIVPNKLDLQSLRFIVCRSEAEKDTLLHLLPETVRSHYAKRILSDGRLSLYNRKHTFADRVSLASDHLTVHFSPDTLSPGPFAAQLTLSAGGKRYQSERTLRANDSVEFPFGRSVPEYAFELTLDGNLACAGLYKDADLLF